MFYFSLVHRSPPHLADTITLPRPTAVEPGRVAGRPSLPPEVAPSTGTAPRVDGAPPPGADGPVPRGESAGPPRTGGRFPPGEDPGNPRVGNPEGSPRWRHGCSGVNPSFFPRRGVGAPGGRRDPTPEPALPSPTTRTSDPCTATSYRVRRQGTPISLQAFAGESIPSVHTLSL